MKGLSPNLIGALCAMAAAICFSVNDVIIKFVSDGYALYQVMLVRTLVGMTVLLLIIVPLTGGYAQLKTRRPGVHIARGFCVVCANMCLFLGLAALPIADAVALYFIAPLVVAMLSIIFLGETVGPRRWVAIFIGLIGVVVIMRPGTTAFQTAAFLPLIAACLYSTMHIIARKAGGTESAACMTFYVLCMFLLTSSIFGLALGDGRYAGEGHPSFEFLVRAWGPIAAYDLWLMVLLGTTGVMGGVLITQAFRLSEAAFAAPFEYVSIPMAVIWGVTVFDTWPDGYSWIGIALILGAGLYLIWRETRTKADD